MIDIQKELEFRKDTNFVEYVPDVLNKELGVELMRECDSLNLPNSMRKASSQWLSPIDEPYIYTDSDPIHHAMNIKRFPVICQVMDIINSRFNVELDSCLILKYTNTSVSTSLHADNESTLDRMQPICNLTIGSSRTIEFLSNSDNRPVYKVVMKDRGLVHMKPGTQDRMKHMVRGDSKKTMQLRYSLSFRALAKKPAVSTVVTVPQGSSLTTPNTPSKAHSAMPVPPQNGSLSNEPVQHQRHVCLVAGDSYANRLDTGKLGRNTVVVESVARGGAQMHQVKKQLTEYYNNNVNTVVDKILISVGTNDIRYSDNFDHLKLKLKSLCSVIKDLYPKSTVFFQLLIPLPCHHKNDWRTNSNVLRFNRAVINECIFRRFHVMDAFTAFCAPQRNFYSPELRDSRYFVGSNIHPSEHRGMGILAKFYLRAIHSKYFDPFTFQ